MRHEFLFHFLGVASIMFGFGVDSAAAQRPVEAWTQRWSFSANTSWDRAVKIATDDAGNVIVLGNSNEGITTSDIVIIKYSGSGAALWTNRYDGPGESTDEGTGLAVGSAGQVFVTGSSFLQEVGSSDYVTLAYSAAGVPLWTNRYDGSIHSNDVPSAIAVDAADNVFVTGSSFEEGGVSSYATLKYSAQGALLWTRHFNGQPDNPAYAASLAVGINGEAVVTGWAAFDRSNVLCVTIQYASTGETLWTNLFAGFGSKYSYGTAAAIDGSGGVVVIGQSSTGWSIKYGSTGIPSWTNSLSGTPKAVAIDQAGNIFIGGLSRAGYERTDYLTLGYSSTGVPLWTNSYHGSCSAYCYDGVNAIAVSEEGNVVVTGRTTDSNTRVDYGTIAYSGTGIPLWTNIFAGPNRDDVAQALAVARNGTVFVTGYSDTGGFDFVTVAYSGTGTPSWTNRFVGVGNESDTVSAIAVGCDGQVFVTGTSCAHGPGNSYENFATIAYSCDGVPSWTNFFGAASTYRNVPVAIGVSDNGNIVVTGYTVSSDSEADFTTIAYTQAGAPLWTNTYNGPGNGDDKPSDMAIDGAGTIFVTGSSAGLDRFADYATIAYAGNGTPLWTNRLTRFYDDVPRAIAVDSIGNVFVTGSSYSDQTFPGNVYLTIAYSNNGSPYWTNLYQGRAGGNDYPTDIVVDNKGRVIVTGNSEGPFDSYSFATLAYLGNGAPLWTNRFGEAEDNTLQPFGSMAQAIAVDDIGNIFVTGSSYKQAGANPDYVTIAYSNAGTPRWTNYYNGPGNNYDIAKDVVVDRRGNVIVTGISHSGGYNYDFPTLFYSNDGVPLSTNRYDGPVKGDEDISGNRQIALGVDGSVYVAGTSVGVYGDNDGSDFALVKYGVPPALLAEATNLVVALGGRAEFCVRAYGTGPLTYRWLFNSTVLDGETNNVLTISNVTAGDEGEYTAIVSSPYGSVTNGVVTLNAHVAPQFQSINFLADRTVHISLTGTSNLAYRLEASSNFVDWVFVTNSFSSNAVFDFIDPEPSDGRQRFYRAVYP